MKKICLRILLAVTAMATCLFTFTACGKDEPEPSAPEYKITFEQSEDYTLEANKTVAESFESIIVTVKMHNSDKKLVGVKFNNEYANEKSDGTFGFLMPAKDVVVSAVTENYVEKLKSDDSSRPFMAFSSGNVKTMVPNSGDFSMYIATNGSYMAILNSKIESSDQSVIPDDAFSVTKECASQSNLIVGAYVHVDTTKISKGTAWVTIDFSNGNTTSQKGTIVVMLTVADEISVDVWTETLTFEVSGASTDTFTVAIYNGDFVAGMPEELEYQEFKNLQAENGKITVTIKYVYGQTFRIGMFRNVAGSSSPVEMKLSESVGSGTSAIGFNQYKNGVLSFINNGASLTIAVA